MTAKRPCLGCGTPSPTSRCPACRRVVRLRYGPSHQRDRAAWTPIVASGTVRCARADTDECVMDDPTIGPDQPWHLDHLANGSTHPSHQRCNVTAVRR
jgi:hypothetical protein